MRSPAPGETAPRGAHAAAPLRHRAAGPRRVARGWLLGGLSVTLVLAALIAICVGAYALSPRQLLSIVFAPTEADRTARSVVLEIRLPRVALGLLCGAGLGASGAALQAIFRNPLADPGLIGVSSGAALGAAVTIVVCPLLGFAAAQQWLPVAAFAGALAVVGLVYRLAASQGRLMLQWLLLAGIAINALVGALIGLLTYLASDAQLRSLTFWSLGSLGGAQWSMLVTVAPIALGGIGLLAWHASALTALQLGEVDAAHLGVAVAQVKRRILIAAALCVGALVSCTGIIGFIGLVAPHCIRLTCGPDQRTVLPGAMLLGALLTVLADLATRTLAAPAEIPLGVLTALLGAPFFLMLLLKGKGHA